MATKSIVEVDPTTNVVKHGVKIPTAQLSDATTVGKSVVTASTAAAARSAIGALDKPSGKTGQLVYNATTNTWEAAANGTTSPVAYESFASGIGTWNGWNGVSVAHDPAAGHTAAGSMKVDVTNGTTWGGFGRPETDRDPITGGTAYTLSMWVKGTPGFNLTTTVGYFSAAGALIVNDPAYPKITLDGTWQQLTAAITTDPGAASLRWFGNVDGPVTGVAAFHVDDITIMPSAGATGGAAAVDTASAIAIINNA